MSPRHNRRRVDPLPERGAAAAQRQESWAGAEWTVRTVTGSAAAKAYRCPGCDHEIRPGVAHVVAWPADDPAEAGLDQRRHWHHPCWAAREHRQARRPRAPGPFRYR